jgi:hypothetical protein
MTRWLLNTFPTGLLSVVTVGSFMLFAVGGHRIARRMSPAIAEGKHSALAERMIGVLLGMFGLVLAFTIVTLYSAYKEASHTVQSEATFAAELYRDSRVFEPEAAAEIDRALGAYIHEVVDNEWPLLAEGRASQKAWDLTSELFTVIQSYEPQTEVQKTFYGESVGKLNEMLGARRARIQEAAEELPHEFLILISCGAFILMGFLWLLKSEDPNMHSLLIAGVALMVGLNILLVVLLDHPFAGDVRVSPDAFTKGALARYF